MAGIDAYTVLMAHMDGTDQSTTFTDSALTPKTITRNGDAKIVTAQSVFGGASGFFDGTGDFLSLADSADFAFGTGALTIDFRVRFAALPASGNAMGVYEQATDGNNFVALYLDNPSWDPGTYYWRCEIYVGGSRILNYLYSTATAINAWYHIALVRSGNVWTVYKNGTGLGSDTVSITWPDLTGGPRIAGSGIISVLNGWLDEYRISKGIARWTANFTSPTRAYSYYANEFLGVANANLAAISFGGSDILEANISNIVYG